MDTTTSPFAATPRKLLSMPHVAMMDTEQRMALHAFFEHVSRNESDRAGLRLMDSFDYEQCQVFCRLYNKTYNYGSIQSTDAAGTPSREARDRFCHRFLPNLCGYEPTESDPNPLPPPALSRRDIEERLRDCDHWDNCWLPGCPRRHAPEGRNFFQVEPIRPTSSTNSDSSECPSPPKQGFRRLVRAVMSRRDRQTNNH